METIWLPFCHMGCPVLLRMERNRMDEQGIIYVGSVEALTMDKIERTKDI